MKPVNCTMFTHDGRNTRRALRRTTNESEREATMAIVEISIDRGQLPEHTDEQFEEWVNFCIGATGDISFRNPLHAHDMTADSLVDWRDD